MKKLKLCFVIALVLLMLPSNFGIAAEKTIDHFVPMDIDWDHWAYTEIDDFINAELIEGTLDDYMDMYVRPDANITRAEFVKIVVTALGLESNGQSKSFTDVKSDKWYYDYVNIASSAGIIQGKADGSFGANDLITRDQITAIIVRAFDETIKFPEQAKRIFRDVPSSHWAYQEINKAAHTGIVNGVSNELFMPKMNTTRAQAIVMLHRALYAEKGFLTDKQELMSFIENHVKKENTYLENKALKDLANLYKQEAIGYYQFLALNSIDNFEIEDYGAVVNIKTDASNMEVKIISLNTRLATIEVKNNYYLVSIREGKNYLEREESMGGIYELKKDSLTGNWKIYNYVQMGDFSFFSLNEMLDDHKE